ncbi:intraflagellar transport protein 88 [Marchantia polymorpha subsp. ruderalis]|uniref:Intraflagellar transport protein 88 homolog n=2 Tax=Marchantia polymorpha TaxID=3197 RepID=A0AAF6AX56_MARPO|nr:hypothetical protein MARPO_0022s0154 [Marchantia polymorpha]BBN04340.1 hypothetical protein Mp_3g03780 [Marchantia polymorpha subsp. ruderalis]|eukprot:PTQ44065.1 hypothetical protein MARPO_0022s0154 [Marchantia polymorpha]
MTGIRNPCVDTLHYQEIDQINLELTFAVCFNLGYQYHANGLQQEALSTYSQIMKNKQFTQGGRLRINMGNIYYEQKKYTLAVKMYRMALDQTPNTHKEIRYRVMRNIGNALMRLGRYQDAAQSYEAVIEIKVDHQACYNLVVCYYILGHLEKTKSVFTKMLLVRHYDSDDEDDDIDGDHSVVLRNDGLREELRTKQNHAFKYILTAARLVAPVLGSTFVEGYDCLIGMLKDQHYVALANEMEMNKALQFLRRQDFVQAISLLKNFERKEKDLKARAATNLSFLYFLEGDQINAEKHAELAVKTNSYNPCALVNHGNCLYSRGDVAGALARYTEAVEVEADCVEAIFNTGLSQKRLESLAEALQTFTKLSYLLPNNVEVLFQIGHVYELLGNYHQAVKWLEIVNTRVMHDAGVLAMLGNLHAKLDDEPKAVHYYCESHRVYPTNMDIISWLGAFYVKSEVYEKAMPFFELASRIQPAEVKWQLMVASCYRRTGQYKMALAKYKSIHAKYPENVECLRYLVHMCTSLGRKDELQQYEQRLRQAERSASRGSTGGDSRAQLPRSEKVDGFNHHQQQQNVPSPRILHDGKRGQSPDRFSCQIQNQNQQQQQQQSSSIPRILSARKSRIDDEEWPDLGDDLLPL